MSELSNNSGVSEDRIRESIQKEILNHTILASVIVFVVWGLYYMFLL